MTAPLGPVEDRWIEESLTRQRYDAATPEEVRERELNRAFRVGAFLGLIAFLVVLTGARSTLLSWSPAADFYDAQADSFLDGRLDIDASRLGIEGFEHDGRTFMYQPPWPAVLRLPVAALTDSYEGRLGQLSLLLALLLALSATRRILLHSRRSIRAEAPVTSIELAGGFSLGLLVAGGSVPLFLASRAWVYHESAMWGMAWTLAALAALLGHRRAPTWTTLALVCGATLGAVGSRASVGAGACAAIGLLAVARLWLDRDEPIRRRLAGPTGAVALLLAAAIPAVAYASLNVAKFGSVASIPFEDQAFTRLSPARQAMLAENGGTLFGPQFAPTTLVHYLRPDGIRFATMFPFVDFPEPGVPVIGDVRFDLVDRTASIPASLPALVVPATVGLWAIGRRRLHDPPVWSAVTAGAAVGCVTIVPFGYVAHRYVADAVPLLVVLAAIGTQMLAASTTGPESVSARRLRVATWTGIAVLVPFTVWVNAGLATVYQRLYVPAPDPDLVAGLVDTRLDLGASPTVVRGDTLPSSAEQDDLAVIGDCLALYVWDGTPVGEFRTDAWIPVERTERAGHVDVRIPVDELPHGLRHAVVVAPRAGPLVVWIERRPDGSVMAGFEGPRLSLRGSAVEPAGRDGVDVVIDPYAGEATIRLGDEVLVTGAVPRGTDVSGLVVGTNAGIAGYESTTPVVEARPEGQRGDDGSLCRDATS